MGPIGELPRNVAEAVDAEINDADGWRWFRDEFLPAAVADTFRPADDVLIAIWRLSQTGEGERIFAWLYDLTLNAPYPATGGSFENTALAAAKHQGRAGVGQTLKKAVAEGRRLDDIRNKGAKP